MTYYELRGNHIAYELNHIRRYNKEEKKKLAGFNIVNTREEESLYKDNSEGMAVIYHILRQIIK